MGGVGVPSSFLKGTPKEGGSPRLLWRGPQGRGGVERTKGKSSGSCPEEAGSTPASITLGKRKGGEEED